MGSYRKVGDDILKEWLDFREEDLGSLTCKEDKEHFIYFEEIKWRNDWNLRVWIIPFITGDDVFCTTL